MSALPAYETGCDPQSLYILYVIWMHTRYTLNSFAIDALKHEALRKSSTLKGSYGKATLTHGRGLCCLEPWHSSKAEWLEAWVKRLNSLDALRSFTLASPPFA